ncbi:17876_t:CDS:2 [Funneliformis caledonium]|uniref:17876_t:CDS:1 n=1 Tax=Funneliformis caledonium TaxID=1117310 RepID=A0A9N8W8L7_9GLOM|nr:17876_t:CDS:2 [Funneliformis caledonium]
MSMRLLPLTEVEHVEILTLLKFPVEWKKCKKFHVSLVVGGLPRWIFEGLIMDVLYQTLETFFREMLIHFKVFSAIGSGGSAFVYAAYWKSTQTKFAIKKFAEGFTKEMILNEIHLMEIMRSKVDFHPNIIRFYGITNFEGVREKPMSTTNAIFVKLYQRCWEREPYERPDIDQVISELNSIDPKIHFISKENDESEIKDDDDFSNCDVTLYY